MRSEMRTKYSISAAFFIGGMEGLEEEYNLYEVINPDKTLSNWFCQRCFKAPLIRQKNY
jgi:hypothetical protein